uniref:Uncharacterized protein n=1 Tax=Rhizophora mucronata TaxID=61149 RepID=A0A2P2IY39_RHIMU
MLTFVFICDIAEKYLHAVSQLIKTIHFHRNASQWKLFSPNNLFSVT